MRMAVGLPEPADPADPAARVRGDLRERGAVQVGGNGLRERLVDLEEEGPDEDPAFLSPQRVHQA